MKTTKDLNFLRFRALLIVLSISQLAGAGQTLTETLTHDGHNRPYTVYVPSSYTGDEPVPIVVNYHGFGSNNSQQENIARMNQIADVENFLVVYPRSVGEHWNVFQDPSKADDIDFTNVLLDQIESDYSVDIPRVYATGMSNGGSMSFLMGATLPNRFAAIAPVSATLPVSDENDIANPIDPTQSPTSSRAIPTLYMLGTEDPLVTYDGGRSPNSGWLYPSSPQVLDAWATNNQCDLETTEMPLPDKVTTDNSTVDVVEYTNCGAYTSWDGTEQIPAEVVHYRINGGGHVWPSGVVWPSQWGTTNLDIHASQDIWDFFSRHTLPFREMNTNCDFNADASCDVLDIDILSAAIFVVSEESQFDLNGDGRLNTRDLSEWLSIAATDSGFSEPYLLGDADLDGTIGASDLNRVGLNWRGSSNKWSDGDFNADGMVDASDLNTLALNWRQSIGAAAPTATVPEPGCAWMVLLAAVVLIRWKRKE